MAIIKRGEIQGYMTQELTEMYMVWKRFRDGYGLPYSPAWGDYPDRFIDTLTLFTAAWEEGSAK